MKSPHNLQLFIIHVHVSFSHLTLFLSSIFLLSLTQTQARVIDGVEVEVGRYNYTVALIDSNGLDCGGSLIKPGYVLTNAYCSSNAKALIGRHDFSDSNEEYEEIDVEYGVIHPDYNCRTWENAIAVFKLVQDSVYTPVDFDTGSVEISAGANVTLLGWGLTEYEEDAAASDVLREGTGEVVSNADCDEALDDEATDDMMCASKNEKDFSCFGDGGGPLIIKGSDAASDVQVGISSWGYKDCDVEGKPGVYTRVSEFTEFIECVTSGGSEECGRVVESNEDKNILLTLDMLFSMLSEMNIFG